MPVGDLSVLEWEKYVEDYSALDYALVILFTFWLMSKLRLMRWLFSLFFFDEEVDALAIILVITRWSTLWSGEEAVWTIC